MFVGQVMKKQPVSVILKTFTSVRKNDYMNRLFFLPPSLFNSITHIFDLRYGVMKKHERRYDCGKKEIPFYLSFLLSPLPTPFRLSFSAVCDVLNPFIVGIFVVLGVRVPLFFFISLDICSFPSKQTSHVCKQ